MEWSTGWVVRPRRASSGWAKMYVADSRFTAAYDQHGGEGAAVLLRDAMKVYAELHLSD